jgi:hypothetical protein
VLARLLAPVVVGGPGRISEDQEALFFGQPPQICDSDESPQRGGAGPSSVGRREPGAVEPRRTTCPDGSGLRLVNVASPIVRFGIVQSWTIHKYQQAKRVQRVDECAVSAIPQTHCIPQRTRDVKSILSAIQEGVLGALHTGIARRDPRAGRRLEHDVFIRNHSLNF